MPDQTAERRGRKTIDLTKEVNAEVARLAKEDGTTPDEIFERAKRLLGVGTED